MFRADTLARQLGDKMFHRLMGDDIRYLIVRQWFLTENPNDIMKWVDIINEEFYYTTKIKGQMNIWGETE